jgi:hypothetical protein
LALWLRGRRRALRVIARRPWFDARRIVVMNVGQTARAQIAGERL